LLVIYAKQREYSKLKEKQKYLKGKILLNVIYEILRNNDIYIAEKILNNYNNKKDAFFWVSVGLVEEAKGYVKSALNFYKEAYSISKAPIPGYYYARSLEINQKYKKALKVYKEIYPYIENKNLKNIIKDRINILSKLVF